MDAKNPPNPLVFFFSLAVDEPAVLTSPSFGGLALPFCLLVMLPV